MPVTEELKQDLARDGAIAVREMFDPGQMSQLRGAFDHSVANPSPLSKRLSKRTFDGVDEENFNDVSNPAHAARYVSLIEELGLADFAAALWGSQHVWFLGEEVIVKSGGKIGRSPWHQDTSYVAAAGPHMLNLWTSFERLPKENALEIVRGSHRGITYDGTAFADTGDPTQPVWGDESFPPLPDIEAEREKDPGSWDVLSWDLECWDALVFHSGALHGGAPVTPSCPTRHTLVFRFYGDECFYRPLPARKPGSSIDVDLLDDIGLVDDCSQTPGEPYRCSAPQLR